MYNQRIEIEKFLSESQDINLINDSEKLKIYIKNFSLNLAKFVRSKGIQKGSVGYTYFVSDDPSFISGKWGEYSPIIFWGYNDYELKNFISSCILYNSIMQNIGYTKIWVEEISSRIPYNIEIILNDTLRNHNWNIEIDEKRKIIRINFSYKVQSSVNILSHLFNSLYSETFQELIKKDVDEGISFYNFVELSETAKKIESEKTINEHIKKIERILSNYVDELSNSEFKLLTILSEKEQKNFAKVIIKMLIIGPYPPRFVRLLNPKQYMLNHKYLGCFAGILRVYDEKIDIQTLQEIYFPVLIFIQNLGYVLTSGYLFQFIKQHALRSAVAAIMARNMSHNIGSHVQHYLSKEDYFVNQDDFWIT